MEKNNGGPAFPGVMTFQKIIEHNGVAHMAGDKELIYLPGMSLRDYFAAHVTEKEIAEIMYDHIIEGDILDLGPVNYSITRQQARYIHADAMLEARDGK